MHTGGRLDVPRQRSAIAGTTLLFIPHEPPAGKTRGPAPGPSLPIRRGDPRPPLRIRAPFDPTGLPRYHLQGSWRGVDSFDPMRLHTICLEQRPWLAS